VLLNNVSNSYRSRCVVARLLASLGQWFRATLPVIITRIASMLDDGGCLQGIATRDLTVLAQPTISFQNCCPCSLTVRGTAFSYIPTSPALGLRSHWYLLSRRYAFPYARARSYQNLPSFQHVCRHLMLIHIPLTGYESPEPAS
jgi:hypothetical protein